MYSSNIFSKLLKPVVCHLRLNGIVCVCYLDDLLVIASSYNKCVDTARIVINLLERLGFIVNTAKPQLVPKQKVRYLGFILDANTMKIILPQEKVERVISKCNRVLNAETVSIQIVPEIAGTLISSCPATRYGMLYTRRIEMDKTRALNLNNGSYSAIMIISTEARKDLVRQITNISSEWQYIKKPTHSVMLTSDASPSGCGAWHDNSETKGHWPLE